MPRITRFGVSFLAACLAAAAAAAAAVGTGSAVGLGQALPTSTASGGGWPVSSATAMLRVGTAPGLPVGAKLIGPLPGAKMLRVDVVLEPRDPARLTRFATLVSTPGTPLFRHYIDPRDLRAAFGPTRATLRRVLRELRAVGLGRESISSDGLSIQLRAPVATLEAAFSTQLAELRLTNGLFAFANTQAPSVPAAIRPAVQTVVGLDSLSAPQPADLVRATPSGSRPTTASSQYVTTGGPHPCAAASAAATADAANTADQLAAAYGFAGIYASGDEGQGTSVALFELEPDVQSDINAYQVCYGTRTRMSYTRVDGGPVGVGHGEATLDIEDLLGLAPQASIQVYDGPDTQVGSLDTYRAIVDGSHANVVATSWGVCEGATNSKQAEATLFELAAARGQSVFAAAGDFGSEGCGPGRLAVDDPASQPFVTGVGGLDLESTSVPPLQTVWDTAGGGAGGGGWSALWKMPTYQSKAPKGLGVLSGYSTGASCGAAPGSFCREVPDVSAAADPLAGYIIYFDRQWRSFGGTSAAAPLWAAVAALADSAAACSGHRIGFSNPALYAAAARNYGSSFGDVTTGDNDVTNSNDGLFPALAGYDMASGLGSPVAVNLVPSLCRPGGSDVVTVPSPGAQTSRQGASLALQFGAEDTADEPVTFAASGLPAGVGVTNAGALTGAPTAGGTYAVTVTGTDTNGTSGSAEFLWTVVSQSAHIISVSGPGAQSTVKGSSVSLQVEANDSASAALTYAGIGLPGSLILDSQTGDITGQIHAPAGRYQVEVTVSDSTGVSASVYFTWTVTFPSDQVTIKNPGAQTTTSGHAVRLQVSATDTAGLNTVFSAHGLPPGLTINPAGSIAGTPTRVGKYTAVVSASDSLGKSGSATFVWAVVSSA